MKFENGTLFNLVIEIFIEVVYSVYKKSEDDYDIENRRKIKYFNLGLIYEDFENELRENILEYHNDELIKEYLYVCFTGPKGFIFDKFAITDKQIVRNQDDAGFILKLKYAVEKFQLIISKWLDLDIQQPGSELSLLDRFERIQNDIKSMNYKVDPVCFDIDGLIKEIYDLLCDENSDDDRFFIENIREECDKIPLLAMKIEIVKNRLIEFKKWKQYYEDKNDEVLKLVLMTFIQEHYCDFEEQCMKEIAKLTNLMEPPTGLSSNQTLTKTTDNSSALYTWHASDTDLIELSIALLKSEAVKRNDGRQMTQKDILAFFELIFGCKIKDFKGKLASALNRSKNVMPFLDNLKAAFDLYITERFEKNPIKKK